MLRIKSLSEGAADYAAEALRGVFKQIRLALTRRLLAA